MTICFLDPARLDRVIDAINTDPEFIISARFMTERIHFAVSESECIFDIRDGVLKNIILSPCVEPWSYSIKGSTNAWTTMLQTTPPPQHDNLWTNMQRGNLRLEGNLEGAYSHFRALVRIIDIVRPMQNEG